MGAHGVTQCDANLMVSPSALEVTAALALTGEEATLAT